MHASGALSDQSQDALLVTNGKHSSKSRISGHTPICDFLRPTGALHVVHINRPNPRTANNPETMNKQISIAIDRCIHSQISRDTACLPANVTACGALCARMHHRNHGTTDLQRSSGAQNSSQLVSYALNLSFGRIRRNSLVGILHLLTCPGGHYESMSCVHFRKIIDGLHFLRHTEFSLF